MSDAVVGGIAVTAIGACLAAAGAVVGAGYAVWKGLTWLSEQAKRELERLEAQLGAPPTHLSMAEARKELARRLALARASAAKRPALLPHTDVAARMVAVGTSPFGSFLTRAECRELGKQNLSNREFTALLELAARRFTHANATQVTRAVVDAAADAGFTRRCFARRANGRQTVVAEDPKGRAVVADIVESDEGAGVNLDLTGFSDGSCHAVMDRLLAALARRDVRLEHARRRAHYSREGITPSAREYSRRTARRGRSEAVTGELREREARRRQSLYERERSKLAG